MRRQVQRLHLQRSLHCKLPAHRLTLVQQWHMEPRLSLRWPSSDTPAALFTAVAAVATLAAAPLFTAAAIAAALPALASLAAPATGRPAPALCPAAPHFAGELCGGGRP